MLRVREGEIAMAVWPL